MTAKRTTHVVTLLVFPWSMLEFPYFEHSPVNFKHGYYFESFTTIIMSFIQRMPIYIYIFYLPYMYIHTYIISLHLWRHPLTSFNNFKEIWTKSEKHNVMPNDSWLHGVKKYCFIVVFDTNCWCFQVLAFAPPQRFDQEIAWESQRIGWL